MAVTLYANAPLPDFLASRAYFSASEFALFRADALAFLDWCDSQTIKIIGFDVWLPTHPGPTATMAGAEGDSEHCRRLILDGEWSNLGAADGMEIVYNMWTTETK